MLRGRVATSLGAIHSVAPTRVADPDFLEGHVEGDRETLINPVVLADAENGVFAAQENGRWRPG